MRLRAYRRGYTLLEVLLATAIGVLLMAGLYTALELTLRHAQAGRDKVNQATLARSLFTRISADVLTNLGPTKPSQPSSSSGQGGGSGNAGAGTTASSTSQSSSSSAGGASSVPGLGGPITFNLGIQGNSSQLVLYVSRVPCEVNALNGDAVPTVSDLRRITYWKSPSGLSRQEIKVATSDDALGVPTDLADDESFVIADEVQSVTFQYFDGSAWQDSWDGSQPPSSGGSNPQGPPALIAVTISLTVPGTSTESGEPKTKSYRHVIPIPTANGASQSASQTSSSGKSP